MVDFEQNEYNLNISQYISTAKTEEEVDLVEVNAKLIQIELDAKAALDKHNAFLKELGLPLIPG